MIFRDARRFQLRVNLQPHQVWPEDRRKPLLPPDVKLLRDCYAAYEKARNVYVVLIDAAAKSKKAQMELTVRRRWLICTLTQKAQDLFNLSLRAEIVCQRGRYPSPPADIVVASSHHNQRML